MATLEITNEQDAYALLDKALSGKLPKDAVVEFKGWPTLELHLKGKQFKGSITPPVMKALLEFQQGIYQSYASAKYDNPAKRLTDHEKEALQINVKVTDGTTGLQINYQEIAKELATQLVTKMTPEQVTTVVLTFAVLFFGKVAFAKYLDYRKETRLAELTDDTERAKIDTMRAMSEQETKRAEILARALSSAPRLENVGRIAEDTHTELLKGVRTADSADIAGVPVTGEAALTLVHNARRKSDEVRLDGVYRLLKLDWSDVTKFKVRVWNTETRLELEAEVQDDTLTGNYKALLQKAEWERAPVKLQINARKVGEEYRGAVILEVSSVPKKAP